MKSSTRTVTRFEGFERIHQPASKNIFTRIADFLSTNCTYIDNLDINQSIARYGSAENMPAKDAAALAAYIKQTAMKSHWEHYAPRPEFGKNPNPPHPDTIPPRRHFMLNVNIPGITVKSMVSAIQFFTAVIKTGLLPHDLSLELDASHPNATKAEQTLIDQAVIQFFAAIATGHQNALQRKLSYRHHRLRFYGTTLNNACAEAFTDILASGHFPEDTTICMPPSQIDQAGLICFAYPDKVDRYPQFTAIAFAEDKMEDQSVNHKIIYFLPLDQPEPSPPPSPASPSKAGLFSETPESPEPMPEPSAKFVEIDEKLFECKLMYDLQNCRIKIF